MSFLNKVASLLRSFGLGLNLLANESLLANEREEAQCLV